MTDTGAHPGVRSLLARFENNSQNNTPSPPSRGRSPVDSDNPDSRPLSKVRASFVAVERITSSPSALKKIVPHIGGTGGLQSPLSPTGNNFGGSRKPWDFPPTSNQEAIGGAKKDTTQENLPGSESVSKPQESFELPIRSAAVATPKMEEPTQGKTLSVDQEVKELPSAATQAPLQTSIAAKTLNKKPSTLHAAKNDSTHKPSSRLSTANHKSPPPSRHPVSSAKPSSEVPQKSAHTSKPVASKDSNKDAAKTVNHKSSRAVLNTTTKPTSRSVRSSTPSHDASKSATAHHSPKTTTREKGTHSSRSPTRGTASPGLTRKPSTLKNSTSAPAPRPSNQTTASLRKQASRVSLPHQTSTERPHSRASAVGTRPVDESFLARMMRPTASSASKTHEKVEAKSPPKPKVARLAKPVQKADEKPGHHNAATAKAKSAKNDEQQPRTNETKEEVKTVALTEASMDDKPMEVLEQSVEEAADPIAETSTEHSSVEHATIPSIDEAIIDSPAPIAESTEEQAAAEAPIEVVPNDISTQQPEKPSESSPVAEDAEVEEVIASSVDDIKNDEATEIPEASPNTTAEEVQADAETPVVSSTETAEPSIMLPEESANATESTDKMIEETKPGDGDITTDKPSS